MSTPQTATVAPAVLPQAAAAWNEENEAEGARDDRLLRTGGPRHLPSRPRSTGEPRMKLVYD